MKNQSILYITQDKYPPFRVDVKILIGKYLSRYEDFKVDILLQDEKNNSRVYKDNWYGGNAFIYPNKEGGGIFSKIIKQLYLIYFDVSVISKIFSNKYQVILIKDKFIINTLLVLFKFLMPSKKFVFWLSFPYPESNLYAAENKRGIIKQLYKGRGKFFQFILYKLVIPYFDAFILQSDQMQKDIEEYTKIKKPFIIMPMAVDEEEYTNLLNQVTPYRYTNPNFLYLGTMVKARKIHVLIDTLVLIRKEIPNCELYLVGSSEQKADMEFLKEYAIQKGVKDAVIFTGNLPRAEAFSYVATADVCISPFYPTPILNSTSPTKLVEYMFFKRPVVANIHPDQLKVLSDSKAGLCVEWGAEEFSKAILELLHLKSNNLDKYEYMGQEGNRYVLENRSYRRLSLRLANFFRSL